MAEGRSAWALVGMKKGFEWDPSRIGVETSAVPGIY